MKTRNSKAIIPYLTVVITTAVAAMILYFVAVEVVEEGLFFTALRKGWNLPLMFSPWVYYGPIIPIAWLLQRRSFSAIPSARLALHLRVLSIVVTAGLMWFAAILATGHPSLLSWIFEKGSTEM
jgi:hypothetical protein